MIYSTVYHPGMVKMKKFKTQTLKRLCKIAQLERRLEATLSTPL